MRNQSVGDSELEWSYWLCAVSWRCARRGHLAFCHQFSKCAIRCKAGSQCWSMIASTVAQATKLARISSTKRTEYWKIAQLCAARRRSANARMAWRNAMGNASTKRPAQLRLSVVSTLVRDRGSVLIQLTFTGPVVSTPTIRGCSKFRFNCKHPSLCTSEQIKCVCNAGLVDDGNFNCVRPEELRRCKANPKREWDPEYNRCKERSCRREQNGCLERLACTPVGAKCVCKEGLVDDGKGNCIKAIQCPPGKCNPSKTEIEKCEADPNKEWIPAGNGCVFRSCSFLAYGCVSSYICDDSKGICVCRDPLVEDANGKCIKSEACPRVGPCWNLPE